jgi:hypothetical protein
MLNPNEVLLELKLVIDIALGICKHRERRFERLGIPARTLQCIAKDNQYLHSGFYKLIIQAPQLGDMRTALQSLVRPHEEQDYFFAAIIGEFDLAALIGWEREIGNH